jgi:polyhydroxyalkanoate synthase
VQPTPSVVESMRNLSNGWFAAMDVLRRAQGDFLDSAGIGPREQPYEVTLSGTFWRLRNYGGDKNAPSLLVVAAPFKRPYVWDMGPRASAIGYCLEQGFRVHLIEWTPASLSTSDRGLADFVNAVCRCSSRISAGAGKPVIMGHSLGGTLAAICCAYQGDVSRGLVLLSAPTCFAPGTSPFRDALMRIVPRDTSDRHPYSGSLLSHMSALASPEAFLWERYWDALLSAMDNEALALHAAVERWALDEVCLPGQLVCQVVNWLYREDRFQRGTLELRGRSLSPSAISVPALAVVNRMDAIVPGASVNPLLKQLPSGRSRLIEHDGEIGVGLQHLAILIGRKARALVWPQIVAWAKSLEHGTAGRERRRRGASLARSSGASRRRTTSRVKHRL